MRAQTSGILSRLADLLHIRRSPSISRVTSRKADESPARPRPSSVGIVITPLRSLRSRDGKPRYSSFRTDDLDLHASGLEGRPSPDLGKGAKPNLSHQSLGRRVTFREEPSPDFEPVLAPAETPKMMGRLSPNDSFTPRTSWVRGCNCQVS